MFGCLFVCLFICIAIYDMLVYEYIKQPAAITATATAIPTTIMKKEMKIKAGIIHKSTFESWALQKWLKISFYGWRQVRPLAGAKKKDESEKLQK